MIEIGLMILLIMVIGILAVSLILSIGHKSKYQKNVLTKGMNGLESTTISLTCPAGQMISFKNSNIHTTRGALVSLGDSKCDAFFQSGTGQSASFFNPKTTIDLLDASPVFPDLKKCEGKQTCSFTVPTKDQIATAASTVCIGASTGKVAFIGTYDCVPK